MLNGYALLAALLPNPKLMLQRAPSLSFVLLGQPRVTECLVVLLVAAWHWLLFETSVGAFPPSPLELGCPGRCSMPVLGHMWAERAAPPAMQR